MKKIILSAAILAGLAFVSCNKDDDKDNNNNNCVTCVGNGAEIEICKEGLSDSQYNQLINAAEASGQDCN